MSNPENDIKYKCSFCSITTNNKKDFEKHLATKKHNKKKEGDIKEISKDELMKNVVCDNCKKTYSSRNGMWKHKKKCNNPISETIEHNKNNDIIQLLIKENTCFKNMIYDIVKNNSEWQTQILDVCKNIAASLL